MASGLLLNTSTLVVSILVLAGVTKMHRVEGDICKEGLGVCDTRGTDCQDRCAARHPGQSPSGDCNPITTPPLCMCYYNCGPPPAPPPPRKCEGGVGLCSARCSDSCCNANCAAKYYQGSGFCNRLGTFWLCQCEYTCGKELAGLVT